MTDDHNPWGNPGNPMRSKSAHNFAEFCNWRIIWCGYCHPTKTCFLDLFHCSRGIYLVSSRAHQTQWIHCPVRWGPLRFSSLIDRLKQAEARADGLLIYAVDICWTNMWMHVPAIWGNIRRLPRKKKPHIICVHVQYTWKLPFWGL